MNNKEDSESFIQRSYEAIVMNKEKDKQADVLSSQIKAFMNERVREYTNSKSKRDNYYEYELFKQMKERILSLEEEIKHKNRLILNLTNKLCSDKFDFCQSNNTNLVERCY